MIRLLKILIFIIILIVIIFAGGMLYLTWGLEAGRNTEINKLDMSHVEDGLYNGEYKSGRWSNTLNIVVKNNKIINIEIIDDVDFPDDSVSNKLFTNIVKAQNTEIDVISGATVTTKAYLKSIENAFDN